jgi:transcriptional regulator with XRE-family HTH domain
MSFGYRLRALRLAAGLSVFELAVKSHVTPASIHRLEASKAGPTAGTLFKLTGALGADPMEFADCVYVDRRGESRSPKKKTMPV